MFSFKKLLIGLIVIILLSALQGCSGRFEQHDREDSKREEVSEDRDGKDKKEDIDEDKNEDKNEDVDEKGEEEDEKDEEDDIRSERDEDKEKDKKDKDKKAAIDEEYEWLIGSWQCSAFSGNVGFVSIYEFKEDGTFSKALGTISGYSRYAQGLEGKFKISENKIIFYDQLRSEAQASDKYDEWWYLKMANSVIKDIPEDDFEKAFALDDEGNLVIDDTAYIRIEY